MRAAYDKVRAPGHTNGESIIVFVITHFQILPVTTLRSRFYYFGMASKKRNATTATSLPMKKFRPDGEKIEDDGETMEDGDEKGDLSIGDLPVEMMATIVSFIPIEQWPTVELVSRYFQKGVFGAWRNKRDWCLRDLTDSTALRSKRAYDQRKILHSTLVILKKRSPMLQSISQFDVYTAALNERSIGILAKFEHLKILNLSHCCVAVRYFARFLETSASRGVLKELHLVKCFRFNHRRRGVLAELQDDELLREAFLDEPNRPSLRLKSLTYSKHYFLEGKFISVLDVSRLEYFKYLEYWNDNVSDSCLVEFLGRCERLVELGFTFSKSWIMDAHVWDALASLPSTNLRKLEIRSTNNYKSSNDGHALASFTEMGRRQTQLTTLTLFNFRLDISVIKAIPVHFKRLEELNLTVTGYDSDTLVYLVCHLRGLKKLAFYYRSSGSCTQINRRVVEAIGLHLRRLISLRLEKPGIVAKDAFVLKNLIHLKELIIPGKFSNNKLLLVLANAIGGQLEQLELDDSSVTNVGMTAIMSKLSNLCYLVLDRTEIGNSTLLAIASSLPHLTMLSLRNCQRLTVAGVQAVIDGCKRLVDLYLGASSVSPRELNYNGRVLRCHGWESCRRDVS